MPENVEYVLSLKDLFSGTINKADSAAKGLRSTMMGLAGMATAGLGLYSVVNLLQGSVTAFNEADKASAQLSASLESTGFAAGRTKEQLDAQALALMKVSTFDDDAITGAQSLLLTFTNIREEILDKTTPAILDLATKMGGDLKSATMQIGKALQDPTHGMMALRKAGVSFSQSQQDVIKNLQATGHLAEAQTLLLQELNKEFGGSAQADANTYAGQMQILKHEFQNVKEEIGGVVMKMIVELKPALQEGIETIKDIIHWLKGDEDALDGVKTKTDAFAMSLLATVGIFPPVINGLRTMWGWLLTAKDGVVGIWTAMKGFFNFIVSAGGGIATYLDAIFSNILNPSKMIDGMKEGAKQIVDAYSSMDLGADFSKGFVSSAASRIEIGNAYANNDKIFSPVTPLNSLGDEAKTKEKKTAKASSVTGSKSYNINITIGNLVKDFNVQTTNITDSAGKIKDMVTQALLSAVNDSQIIAER